ncbi:hypothetical protein ACS8Y6_17315, partial [Salinisphaera sp. RV14]|uniref:hypothetical protein n=1 Tax=Salinisphaera sp. RV14 TaxID=3454140 RepID=UPI003F85D06C
MRFAFPKIQLSFRRHTQSSNKATLLHYESGIRPSQQKARPDPGLGAAGPAAQPVQCRAVGYAA